MCLVYLAYSFSASLFISNTRLELTGYIRDYIREIVHQAMHSKTLFLLVSLAFGLPAAFAVSPAAIVNLGYAQYQGVTNSTNNITAFFGLRYAAPPTGQCPVQSRLRLHSTSCKNADF